MRYAITRTPARSARRDRNPTAAAAAASGALRIAFMIRSALAQLECVAVAAATRRRRRTHLTRRAHRATRSRRAASSADSSAYRIPSPEYGVIRPAASPTASRPGAPARNPRIASGSRAPCGWRLLDGVLEPRTLAPQPLDERREGGAQRRARVERRRVRKVDTDVRRSVRQREHPAVRRQPTSRRRAQRIELEHGLARRASAARRARSSRGARRTRSPGLMPTSVARVRRHVHRRTSHRRRRSSTPPRRPPCRSVRADAHTATDAVVEQGAE